MRPRLTISEGAYRRDMKEAVDAIFSYATNVKDWTWSELAENANLSIGTVHRLGTRVTKLPRWQTFWKLATALGLVLTVMDIHGKEVTASKVKKLRLA